MHVIILTYCAFYPDLTFHECTERAGNLRMKNPVSPAAQWFIQIYQHWSSGISKRLNLFLCSSIRFAFFYGLAGPTAFPIIGGPQSCVTKPQVASFP